MINAQGAFPLISWARHGPGGRGGGGAGGMKDFFKTSSRSSESS